MATDAEARAAGFATPAGTDRISGGDDAIRQNARAALDYVNTTVSRTMFAQPYSETGGPLDDLNYRNDPHMFSYGADWGNTPTDDPGLAITGHVGPSPDQRMQIAFPYGDEAGIYYRYRNPAFGWSFWEPLHRDTTPAEPAATSGTPSLSFKTVPLALTVGGGGSARSEGTQGGVRIPMRFGATVTRYRVHFRNINTRAYAPGPGTVNIPAVWVGDHAGDGIVSGGYTQVAAGLSSSSGGDMVTPWISAPLEAGREYLLTYQWNASQETHAVVGGGWTTATQADAAANGATATHTRQLPLDVWLEAEVSAHIPVVAAHGDSLSSGVGATFPVLESWLSQWARANGVLPVHYAASGDSMGGSSDSEHYKWQRWQHLTRPDAVIHAMGSNDVFGGQDLAGMISRRAHSLAQLRELVSENIYSLTIMPRDNTTWDAMEETRRAYNAHIMSAADTRDVFDIVSAVSLDDETLIDSLDADGIHLNTDGYAAVAAAITRPVASPSLDVAGAFSTYLTEIGV